MRISCRINSIKRLFRTKYRKNWGCYLHYNYFLKFSTHSSVIFFLCRPEFPGKTCRQIYGKYKASDCRNVSTGTPPKFVSRILCCVALVYKSYFFRTAILRKLFDILFSYYPDLACSRLSDYLGSVSFRTGLPTRKDGFQNRDKVD